MSKNKRGQAFCAQVLLRVLQSYPSVNSYVVGFSGGADSTALLHALNSLRNQLDKEISAVHVNHGLYQDSSQWQTHCKRFCHEYGIHLTCVQIEITRKTGKGLEAEARSLRYKALTGFLDEGSALLTGHHADDQSETLLLNLMRGSGVDGLSAMPESRVLGNGLLQRPLLEFTNEQLIQYLRQHGIEWIDDPSNQLLDQDRNFVRHEIIPRLEKRWPGVNRRLLLTREAMADARSLLEKTADQYLDKLLCHPNVMKLSGAMVTDPQLLKLVIRRWTRKMGANPVPAYKLADFSMQVVNAQSRHQSELSWDDWKIRLYQQRLWLFEGVEVQPCPSVDMPCGDTDIYLGRDVGRLVFSPGPSITQEIDAQTASQIDNETGKWPTAGILVTGRNAASADNIRQGGIHKKTKKLLQAAGIPPWLRDCIPLCQQQGALVAIGDWCFECSFKAGLRKHNVVMQWLPEHPLLKFIATEQHARQAEYLHRNRPKTGVDKLAFTTTVDPEGAVR